MVFLEFFNLVSGSGSPKDEHVLDLLAKLEKLEKDWPQMKNSPQHRQIGSIIRGGAYILMNDYTNAEQTLNGGLKLMEETVGPEHPDTLAFLQWAAVAKGLSGDFAGGQAMLRRLLDVMQKRQDEAAAGQSERQQLLLQAKSRAVLSMWMWTARGAGVRPEEMMAVSALSKGRVATRQRSLRRLKTALECSGDRQDLLLFKELEAVSRQLATLAMMAPEAESKNEGRLKALQQLADRKERLEGELAARSAVYRQEERRANPTLADLRKVLSTRPGTVLVDIQEYNQVTPPSSGKGKLETEPRLLAFVLRGDTNDVRLVELGPSKPIGEGLGAWLKSRGAGQDGREAGKRLRALLWSKIEPALQRATNVLISHDGALSLFPWGALPGSKPGTFLIEEYAFGLVPVPRLLPELLLADSANIKAAPSLLVMGDVDYGSDPGVAVAMSRLTGDTNRHRALPDWPELRGTRAEMFEVKDSFEQRFKDGTVKLVRRDQATEEAFRDLAPRSHYLHIATHGYFAAKSLLSHLGTANVMGIAGMDSLLGQRTIIGWDPGLLSGLVLAGANQPPQGGKDDGILTALEMQALDLRNVELAVLSACETSLGLMEVGEGVLGLQRALQLAGARTTIGSLWKVDDKATQTLMSEFYRRLWEQKKGKLEALRANIHAARRQGPGD